MLVLLCLGACAPTRVQLRDAYAHFDKSENKSWAPELMFRTVEFVSPSGEKAIHSLSDECFDEYIEVPDSDFVVTWSIWNNSPYHLWFYDDTLIGIEVDGFGTGGRTFNQHCQTASRSSYKILEQNEQVYRRYDFSGLGLAPGEYVLTAYYSDPVQGDGILKLSPPQGALKIQRGATPTKRSIKIRISKQSAKRAEGNNTLLCR